MVPASSALNHDEGALSAPKSDDGAAERFVAIQGEAVDGVRALAVEQHRLHDVVAVRITPARRA